ncbi:MAG: hypothetical protein OXU61_13245 [Gammaproteobacteria bacterium]|nr:hypothetical protein [Gammaproteobacteria bacterium]
MFAAPEYRESLSAYIAVADSRRPYVVIRNIGFYAFPLPFASFPRLVKCAGGWLWRVPFLPIVAARAARGARASRGRRRKMDLQENRCRKRWRHGLWGRFPAARPVPGGRSEE